jgi:hypothetical protein
VTVKHNLKRGLAGVWLCLFAKVVPLQNSGFSVNHPSHKTFIVFTAHQIIKYTPSKHSTMTFPITEAIPCVGGDEPQLIGDNSGALPQRKKLQVREPSLFLDLCCFARWIVEYSLLDSDIFFLVHFLRGSVRRDSPTEQTASLIAIVCCCYTYPSTSKRSPGPITSSQLVYL